MTRSKIKYLGFLLFLASIPFSSQAQKGYTKAEIDEFSAKVEDQVRFLEYLLNTIGASDTPARDKDVVIRESYLKIFRDGQVQVEDDLLLDRKVITNKNVTSYLKDIEFFYRNIGFNFKVREVKSNQKDNGDLFFVVSMDRTINATGLKGEKITNTKPRFMEVNLDPKSQELKIASIYTTKLSRDEELKEWWGILSPQWKSYFLNRFRVENYDSIEVDQLYRFVSVDSLDISGTDSLLDLSPMEAMRDLKYVNLSNTRITELGPISNVTFLEYLDVSNTPTSDIQFVKYSDRLKHLNISNTQIQDIDELANLKSIQTLEAVKTPIMSFAVLNEFDSLRSLNIAQSGFNNPENIKELKKLENLNISGNYLINFSSLEELHSLKSLNLSRTNVQDIAALGKLDNLEVVDLTGTEVSDISPLNSKPKLSKILADETKLTVVAADNFIRNNQKVLLIHHVKDLESWWAGLSEPWKETLKKANPRITDDHPNVETLTTTVGLEELDLEGSGIETLNPVARFVKLRKLVFSENQINDLIPLSEAKTLEEIYGVNTMVEDLSPLKSNDKLKKLDLSGSPVNSILDIIDLPALVYINVDGSAISQEEVPQVLIRKPNLIIIYREEELNNWWSDLSGQWKDMFKTIGSLSDDPSSEELHELTGRSSLEFERVSITGIEPLKAFVNLRSLTIFDAPLMDIAPVRELKHLEKLRVSQVPVADLSPISGLTNLKELDLSNTGVENLSYLSNLNQLKSLNLSGTNLKVLKGLENLNSLEELDVASTNLRSLKPIQRLESLRKLSCFNTRLSSRAVDLFQRSNPDCEIRYY